MHVRCSDLRLMEDGFDVVSVRADDKRCVVAPAVLRTHSGCTIVLAPGFQRGAIEVLDLLSGLSREGQVEMRGVLLDTANAKGGWVVRTAELDTERAFRDDLDSEGRQSLDEEVPGFVVVAD